MRLLITLLGIRIVEGELHLGQAWVFEFGIGELNIQR